MADPQATSSFAPFVSADEIRTRFSRAMSDMYRNEVPQYGTLLDLVAEVNADVLHKQPAVQQELERAGDLERLNLERHGAIRLGTAYELSTMRRLFAVMGMQAVGYYDLSVAGVPVHATAFRPVADEALRKNPFRVFTSLLRLELIADADLRAKAADIVAKRQIYTPEALHLINLHEAAGGLSDDEANAFVQAALETFRWHSDATVDLATYQSLQQSHRLLADVVCFKGPHINHLTPRTLDIDAIQALMPARGINAKDVVEGPPRRACPILLRQTSFKALEEAVRFSDHNGSHTARFGEIEQRGVALTPKGRALYDDLLAQVRSMGNAGSAAPDYVARLAQAFEQFPDSHAEMREQGLAYYRYRLTEAGAAQAQRALALLQDPAGGINALVAVAWVAAEPITYEDFLPVSAAGIFQSNLGGQEQRQYQARAARQAFEHDLGTAALDELALYAQAEQRSQDQVQAALQAALAMSATLAV